MPQIHVPQLTLRRLEALSRALAREARHARRIERMQLNHSTQEEVMSQALTVQCRVSAADATTVTLTPLHGGAQASPIPTTILLTYAASPANLTVGTTVRLALHGGQ